MPRSLSVPAVIVVSVIVRAHVGMKRVLNRLNGPLKNISQAEQAVVKMLIDNNALDNVTNKK